MSRRFCGVLFTLCTSILLVVSWSNLAVPQRTSYAPETAEILLLTLQVKPHVKPETLKLIAEVAEPLQVIQRGDRPLKDILKMHYGFFNAQILSLFKKFNSWTVAADMHPSGEIFLPAGPRWAFNIVTTIPAGSTISNQALVTMGSAGPKTLRQIASVNPGLRGNVHKIAAGTKVTLPYKAEVVSYRMRAEYWDQIPEIRRKLLSDSGVTTAEFDRPARLIPAWTTTQLSSASPGCEEQTRSNWHFESLLKDVSFTRLKPAGKTLIAVVDSGIIRDDQRFANVLWQNLDEARGRDGDDDDLNGYRDDIIGLDLNTGGFPKDDIEREDLRNHGTHVAGLVSGRLLPPADAAHLENRVRLMILKVADSDGYVSPGAVQNAIVYTQQKAGNVVNLSFEGPFQIATRELMANNKNLLFVVAAGNGRNFRGIDLDSDRAGVFPAKHARELSNVISVAAHDSRGRLTCFSNYGAQTVDLAAPGLEVDSTVSGGTAKLSGTSQAAPLVSLAAALLISMDIKEPGIIKRRLLASVDFISDLQGKTVSEGKLNLAKALSIEDDVLELADGTLVRGRVLGPKELHVLEESQPIPLRSVHKIIFNYPTKEGPKDRIIYLKDGSLRYIVAEPIEAPITVRLPNGGLTEFRRQNLRDLVPALILPRF